MSEHLMPLEEIISFPCLKNNRNSFNLCEHRMYGKVLCEHLNYDSGKCSKKEWEPNPPITLHYYQGVD